MAKHFYTVKEFAINPSRLIHQAMKREEDIVITLRGIPAVQLVPMDSPAEPPSILGVWATLPDMAVAREAMVLPPFKVTLSGAGPTGADLLLEDRR
jgi:antitoxin (DNA-binding transcriptional repressor) of toxin-antitoxin stability system